jgi:hypothetical protein
MNPSALQGWIDELHATSPQQWFLRLLIVAAPLGAVLAVTAEVGTWWPFGLVVLTALAGASAIRPDAHTALFVIAVVAAHWLLTVERLDTPWLPVASCCLLVFHAATALGASFPAGGDVPTATIVQWLRRTFLGGCVTVGMWVLVVLFDRREAPGNGLLTGLALAIVAAAAVTIRSRSLDESR